MSFLVTARKWRPKRFDEVVGQEHISTTIKNAILNNRIAHAYLFAGPRGVGKTTTARIFAKILNCTNPKDGEPCNSCEMCDSFNNSQSLDIIEIDGASNRRIEEIRTLRESVKYAPTKGQYKVYIIDEVHMLTTESFNALLKTLEEPPDRTIFIFATTDIHKVPLTIVSRCQRFDFRRIELDALKSTLSNIAKSEKISIDDESLTIISKKADGALRDAQSIFDQIVSFCGMNISSSDVSQMLNLINDEIYFDVTKAIIEKNFSAAFTISNSIYSNGWNYDDFLNGLVEHLRNIMTVVATKKTQFVEGTDSAKSNYENYINNFSESDLLRLLSLVNRVQYEIKNSQNQKLKVEVALCQLIGLEKSSTISELLSKVNSLPESSKKKVVEQNTNNSDSTHISLSPQDDEKELNEISNENENLTLTEIRENWNKFIELVSSQKFTLGSHLNQSIPYNLKENTLTIELTSQEDHEIVSDNRNYLSCLIESAKQIYDVPFEFNFIFKEKTISDQTNNKSGNSNQSISNVDTNLSSEENSLINAIINELGGREINR
jgi:DNA polymerase-3 subunit gamma/tau